MEFSRESHKIKVYYYAEAILPKELYLQIQFGLEAGIDGNNLTK